MIQVERCYGILDLEPDASPEEIHQGYLDLTWVWHPDRFTGHPRLQKKALYKLQELNEAHEQLRSCRPTPQIRDVPAKSTSQVSSPPHDQPSANDWHKQEVNQAAGGENERTFPEYRRPVSFNARDVGEWLD